MRRSRFHIAAMDCPSEEALVRGVLADADGVVHLEFDLAQRRCTIHHRGDVDEIKGRLQDLDLGATLDTSDEVAEYSVPAAAHRDETNVLRLLLAINAVMFVVEAVAGWVGDSTGLMSDSLDMLADATVYGISLGVVGKAAVQQQKAAAAAGWLELALALGVLFEVGRRAIFGGTPEAPLMLGTATLALIANVTCLLALAKHRTGGVHMQASWIFSANDVIANLGVIAAGALVAWTSSAIPDLVIGAIIGLVVLRGALRILRLSRKQDDRNMSSMGSPGQSSS